MVVLGDSNLCCQKNLTSTNGSKLILSLIRSCDVGLTVSHLGTAVTSGIRGGVPVAQMPKSGGKSVRHRNAHVIGVPGE